VIKQVIVLEGVIPGDVLNEAQVQDPVSEHQRLLLILGVLCRNQPLHRLLADEAVSVC